MQPFTVDDALIEMDWGEWEGETLEGLKARARMMGYDLAGLIVAPPPR